MSIKIGVIGPTNIQKLSRLTEKPENFFIQKAEEIGKMLAEFSQCELWINSDKGMIMEVACAYKKNGGKKLVILTPAKAEPWPKKHAEIYEGYADELRKEESWFWTNYNVTALPDFCICLGLSAGTLSELAYIKWNHQFRQGNLKKLIAIRELLRGGCLPPEIEEDIKEILINVEQVKELKQLLANILTEG